MQAALAITSSACRSSCSSAAASISTRWLKATSLDGILAAVADTPWEKVLEPMKAAKPDRGLTAQAEPLLQDRRHKALVALAPAKKGTSAAPNLRDLVELECDTSAVSNAARLIPYWRTGFGGAFQRPPRLHGYDERRVGYLLAHATWPTSRRGSPRQSTARCWATTSTAC